VHKPVLSLAVLHRHDTKDHSSRCRACDKRFDAVKQLVSRGFVVKQLVPRGFAVKQLVPRGFAVKQLVPRGFAVSSLCQGALQSGSLCQGALQSSSLCQGVCSQADYAKGFAVKQLVPRGFAVKQLVPRCLQSGRRPQKPCRSWSAQTCEQKLSVIIYLLLTASERACGGTRQQCTTTFYILSLVLLW
jgi:hypothetical protein